jgi:hypothetical protein
MNNAESIIRRIKDILGIEKDLELAEWLGLARPNVISNWRSRGSVPLEYAQKVCESHNVSLDYIYYGKDSPRPAADPKIAAMIALMEGLSEEQQREIQAAVAKAKRFNEMNRQIEELQAQLKKLTGT